MIPEDVLTSINPSYNIEVSLLERLRNPNDANQQALEAVENQIGAKISQVVFNAWSKFQKVSAKEIVAKTGKDGEKFFLKLSVKEGHQTFSLAEKSLGFRWFFTFLLFTEFRKERIKTSGEILFLLDEPASNLHQTAQQSLLDTFQGISSKSRLIYTTHSHHLINPALLDAVYIIKNQGLNLENDPDFNLSMTEIDAYKYKQFVSSHPLQTSYFQPILDVLDYRPGLLEYIKAIVITEGKFDYFTFRYFKEVIFQDLDDSWGFYPGHSATKLDLPISMYEAWGRKYLVLLDADPTGKTQKKRYIRDYSDTDHVFTLADVNSIHDGKNLEVIFSEDELINTCKEFDPTSTKFEKGTFNLGIQKLYSEKQVPEYFTDSTKQYFHEFLELSRG
jgi:energy-coupling factor transporter ATP-binding protein EcfA2